MGGRELTTLERLRYRVPDWPELARKGFFAFLRTLCLFVRWVYLKATRKTAYRFAPMYETKSLDPNPPRGTISPIRQANGLYVPGGWKQADTCDWRAALLEQIEKQEKLDKNGGK